uniref:Uncharacterized protein n=1 Tax=Trichobilharzia regenti TaxID=157069 RepID=A0AA85K529_TRIRE|nr:unnamed protein product [Trichobilharzia regenti]
MVMMMKLKFCVLLLIVQALTIFIKPSEAYFIYEDGSQSDNSKMNDETEEEKYGIVELDRNYPNDRPLGKFFYWI